MDPANSDRTWPLPRGPWVLRMTWSSLLFAHWRVDADLVQSQLPSGLQVDTRDGDAWVGVVPFAMSDIAPRGCPAVPWLSRFLELNVRTYVVRDGKPGVWFFSLDAANPVAVRLARWTFNLPYMNATMALATDAASGAITYRSSRTHRGEVPAEYEAVYEPQGDAFQPTSGTLDHWLTARYCLYSANRSGKLFRGEILHPPWNLRRAKCETRTNTMGDMGSFDLSADPHLLYADPIDVRAWLARPVAS